MFHVIVVSCFKVLASTATLIGGFYVALQLSEKSGFEKYAPSSYQKLTSFINGLLEFLVEYWFVYIVGVLGLGTLWAFVVEKARIDSKAYLRSAA